VNIGRRPSLFEETVRVVRGLLAGETVSSELLGLTDARIGVTPPEPVEWWIGAFAEPALDRAARIGDSYYAGPASIEQASRALRTYLECCETYGRTPKTLAARADVIVTADPTEARRLAEDLVARGYRGMTIDSIIAGSPEQVAERFAPFGEAGYQEMVCRCMTVPQSVAVETIGLLAEVRRLLGG
jgi:alkanesulfonate monooxygenase SsuD/methylene tetrahydromethanopterin reductase-like flavin-dependent oxidoreductase (luciferase family)